jgi:hypothetical protein
MTTRQEYEAKLEKWLEKWEDKIRTAEAGGEKPFQEKLDEMKVVHRDIRGKLSDMKQSDDDRWQDMKDRVDKMVGHIDESFRESLAYFH